MGFKYDINRYLASHGDRIPVKSLAEIVKSGRFHPTVQRRLEQAEQGQGVAGSQRLRPQLNRGGMRPDVLWTQHHNGIWRSTDNAVSWHEVTDVPLSSFGVAVAKGAVAFTGAIPDGDVIFEGGPVDPESVILLADFTTPYCTSNGWKKSRTPFTNCVVERSSSATEAMSRSTL